jgi:hypothetical protein
MNFVPVSSDLRTLQGAEWTGHDCAKPTLLLGRLKTPNEMCIYRPTVRLSMNSENRTKKGNRKQINEMREYGSNKQQNKVSLWPNGLRLSWINH